MAASAPPLTCPFCQATVEQSLPPRASDRDTLRGTDADCEQCRSSFAVYYY